MGVETDVREHDQPSPTSYQPGQQHTLAQPFVCRGVGLHSGASVQTRVCPAEAGAGRYFVRTDLPDAPRIPALGTSVAQTLLSTELGQGEAQVRTVEHLLAALAALGIDNARIEVDGPEMPLLDGSAREWAQAIQTAGVAAQTAAPAVPVLAEPVWVRDGDVFVAALPSPEQRFTYGIQFDLEAIGNQWFSWAPPSWPERGPSFVTEVAPARTFGLAHQIEYLRSQGLIRGGSLDNALVCSETGWLNPPLRFPNEPARHKLLDLIGDLSLLGTIPQAHFIAYKASHQLHVQLVHRLVQLE